MHHTLNGLEELLEALEHLEKYNLKNTSSDYVILIDADSETKITRKRVIRQINQYKDRLLQLDSKIDEYELNYSIR